MNPIFTRVLLLSMFSGSLLFAQSWPNIDTTNGRYWSNVFPNVTVTSNIQYGQAMNLNNSNQNLFLDIYQPTGDTVSRRPVIILAHGGSFIGGSKTSTDLVTLSTEFAKKGYVVASISYRLGIGFPIDSVNATKAVIRATQDMKAAVRFFRQDALGSNTYKTHPNYVFAGGVSAGAFMGLHLAYLDKLSEVPSWVNIASLGGLDGNSGNPGYSHKVNAVINLCGALGDSTWIEPGDIPFVSMHGNNDNTVPFGTAMIYISSFPIMVVDGSASLKLRADNVGVPNSFHPWWGAGHTPFISNATYMDSTITFVKTFLRPLLGAPSTTGVSESTDFSVKLFPNPSTGLVNISGNFSGQTQINLIDLGGKILFEEAIRNQTQSFDFSFLAPGVYFIRIQNESGGTLTRKLIIGR